MTLTERETKLAAACDSFFAAVGEDSLYHELSRRAYGDEHPEGITVASSCTHTALEHAEKGLALRPGDTLVDLGCGMGGPGQWLARRTGARLIGVDLSEVALEIAARKATGYLCEGTFEYVRGTFAATGLPDGCADGVVSIDALPMARDREAALAELRRVLKSGGRAFFTCVEWDGDDPMPARHLTTKWEPLVTANGFEVVATHVDRDQPARYLRLYELWLEREAALRERLGERFEV